MSKPVSINQYYLGLCLSGAFLLLVGLGEGRVGWGVGGVGDYYWKEGLVSLCFLL